MKQEKQEKKEKKKELTLSHLDSAGRARMVDVTDKQPSSRMARAEATVSSAAR